MLKPVWDCSTEMMIRMYLLLYPRTRKNLSIGLKKLQIKELFDHNMIWG